MIAFTRILFLCALCSVLVACNDNDADVSIGAQTVSTSDAGAGGKPEQEAPDDGTVSNGVQPTQADIDRSCDNAPYPSAEWTLCEAQNFAHIAEAPAESLNPIFQAAQLAQSTRSVAFYGQRIAEDPSYLPVALPGVQTLLSGLSSPSSLADALTNFLDDAVSAPTDLIGLPLNTPLLTECSLHAGPCVGDPFRYPDVDGPNGRPFFEEEAEVEPVVFYDRDCARLAGHVWRPRNTDQRLPGVVFEVGSVGAPETLYRWLPQLLVRHGYAVLTMEARGQGFSDFATPSGGQGTNINPKVFWENLVDGIDFFRSTPDNPYPNETSCAGTYPTETTKFNPQHAALDLDRLGIAGHSLGGIGVTAVQGYGATGADPWPGRIDDRNPVDVAVAFDGLLDPKGDRPGGAIGPLQVILPQLAGELSRLILLREFPNVGPRVPIMGQSSEYGLLSTPYVKPPDPEAHKEAFDAWQAASVPVYELTIRGSAHLDWSPVPPLPSTSLCPHPERGVCEGGFALPIIEHYTLAWFDRWLKKPDESGYQTADARLLDDGGPEGAVKMSYRFHSARDFSDRAGQRHRCADVRAGCLSGP